MEFWCNCTDRGEAGVLEEKTVPQLLFFVCKCHMDPPGNECGPPRGETGN